MNAKETLAEIKELGLLRAGNLQEKLNVMAVSFEEELIELRGKCDALQTSQDNIINGLGIKGDGPYSKLVIEYALGLVAENVALKDAFKPSDIASELTDVFGDTAVIAHDSAGDNQGHSVSWSWVGNQEDVIKAVLSEVSSRCETPATDAAIAEIKAQGVDEFTTKIGDKASQLSPASNVYKVLKSVVFSGVEFAANLRAGRKDDVEEIKAGLKAVRDIFTRQPKPVVVLPRLTVGEVMHRSGFDRQYAEGWVSANDWAINELKLAGIVVKDGE